MNNGPVSLSLSHMVHVCRFEAHDTNLEMWKKGEKGMNTNKGPDHMARPNERPAATIAD